MKFDCFKVLQKNQAEKIKTGLIIEHMTNVRNLHTHENVFDELVLFLRVKQIKREQNERLKHFLDYNLKKKGLKALFLNKISSLTDVQATDEIH